MNFLTNCKKHFLCLFCAVGILGAAYAQPLPTQAADSHLGVVNCANSLCHGAVTTWKDSNILQNEYITWSRVDKHARSFGKLLTTRSKDITRKLGMGAPEQEKLCLDCHTHNPGSNKRGERFVLTDGVQCEACHGPAERWIKTHTEPDVTHKKNIDNGLFPTENAVALARLCISCHVGNADKAVTHRIMGAGHPRMSFELDTFVNVAPAHYVADKDWLERKGPWSGVRLWAVGQSLIVADMMEALTDSRRGRDGIFPELTFFDCHACHHPMSEKKWTPRVAGLSPGVVRLNDSSMLMVQNIARRLDRGLGEQFSAQSRALHAAIAGRGDYLAEARKLKALAEQIANRAATHNFDGADLRALVLSFIEDGLGGQFSDYAGAEQATMAISSLSNFMFKQGILKNAGTVNDGLSELLRSVNNDERFDRLAFQNALKSFRSSVGL